ncbi:hypothetical protein N7457_000580 [Penicillium paradoxum]|uniref:uncharacterized protein n=1 Tax=Penicillium paradoxum TaxID=176176 RepID=UPI0025489B3E|nr:uncharacterized protein N7457_000580 [Penicillium paradoxum]KAJ5793981.1 hypothetical protein N7457_000580 [Penicillium paradoxum]
MAFYNSFRARLGVVHLPPIHDGMIVVRRPANNNETAIFWTSNYFLPSGSSEPIAMNYESFLSDLRFHLQYDPAYDHILFHVPTPYELFPLDPALPGVEAPQDVLPVTCVVRGYGQWISALVVMQSSRLMQQSNIEHALRDGFVTTSVGRRTHPVAATQFFLIRGIGMLVKSHPTDRRAISNIEMQMRKTRTTTRVKREVAIVSDSDTWPRQFCFE